MRSHSASDTAIGFSHRIALAPFARAEADEIGMRGRGGRDHQQLRLRLLDHLARIREERRWPAG